MVAATLALIAVMALALSSLWALAATGVPVVASAPAVVEAALAALAVKPGERLVDLGCGFGRVLAAARQRGAEATGYELNFAVWAVTWLRFAGDRRVHVRLGDARRARLGRVDAVFAYLMPSALGQLAQPLERELAQGTRVASASFAIPGWKSERVLEVGPLREPIFLYVIGRAGSPQTYAGA